MEGSNVGHSLQTSFVDDHLGGSHSLRAYQNQQSVRQSASASNFSVFKVQNLSN